MDCDSYEHTCIIKMIFVDLGYMSRSCNTKSAGISKVNGGIGDLGDTIVRNSTSG